MIISERYGLIFIKSSKCAGTSLELFLDPLCGPDDVVTPFFHPERGQRPRNFEGDFDPEPERQYLRGQPTTSFGGSTPSLDQTDADVLAGRRFYEAMPAWQLRCRIGWERFGEFFSFAIERNPWDKVLSRLDHWNSVNTHGLTITVDELLDHLEANWLSPLFQLAPVNFPRYADPLTGEVLVSRLCKFDRLNAELAGIFRQLDVPFQGSLPVLAKAGYRDGTRHYRQRLTEAQGRRIGRLFSAEIDLMGFEW